METISYVRVVASMVASKGATELAARIQKQAKIFVRVCLFVNGRMCVRVCVRMWWMHVCVCSDGRCVCVCVYAPAHAHVYVDPVFSPLILASHLSRHHPTSTGPGWKAVR
jgi:hypothetical protein